MRETLRLFLVVLVLSAAVPVFAAVGADVTLPVTGYLQLPNDLLYRTELTITNHRDVEQYVMLELISEGYVSPVRAFSIPARESKFLAEPFGSSNAQGNFVGALRVRSIVNIESSASDPNGVIEARGFIVAERGRFGSHGSSRQEVEGIPSQEYAAREAVFLGVRHAGVPPAYTNVGIVNMSSEPVTFYVQFEFKEAEAITVAPLSHRQMRISGPGNSGRFVRVTPEWALSNREPTEWVAYASTIDSTTGDAFSGLRVPAGVKYDR